MLDRLDALATALCKSDGKRNPLEVAKDAGFQPEEVIALCSRPDAIQKMLHKSTIAYLVPSLPIVLRRIAEKAASGNPDAEKQVLALLGNKSEIRDQMGVDVTAASDDALVLLAGQLSEQLLEIQMLKGKRPDEQVPTVPSEVSEIPGSGVSGS